MAAKPSISWSTRVDPEVDKRLDRLLRKFNWTKPELMARAAEALEAQLAGNRKTQAAS
jgi:predicted transcriptional regulator